MCQSQLLINTQARMSAIRNYKWWYSYDYEPSWYRVSSDDTEQRTEPADEQVNWEGIFQ